MLYRNALFVLLVLREINSIYSEDQCSGCVGEQYECINGLCYCSAGHIPDYHHTGCVRCPGLGEKCHGACCSAQSNDTLQCWFGVCRSCYGPQANWICREPMEQLVLVSGSQIVMAVALVFGLLVTFTLLYKLCAVPRVLPPLPAGGGRLSLGSLQIRVDERLRDAPPKYSPPALPAQHPAQFPMQHPAQPPAQLPAQLPLAPVCLRAGFVHDDSVPPPPYARELKHGLGPTAIHM